MSVRRVKTAKVTRKAKKNPPAKMKKKMKKRSAKEKPDVSAAASNEEELQDVDVAVLDAEVEPKTRLDLIRSRHNVMKKEIDQIRAALEEERDE